MPFFIFKEGSLFFYYLCTLLNILFPYYSYLFQTSIMQSFLSILRGINVGGQRKIKMDDLKKLYETLGFQAIQTYIQSGNIVFQAESDENLAEKIEIAIQQQFGFEVPVLVRTRLELAKTVADNPFLSKSDMLVDKLHVTFLNQKPSALLVEKINALDFQADRFRIIERDVYIYCPESYGNSKLTNSFFETKLKTKATTRNWKTVNQLLDMM